MRLGCIDIGSNTTRLLVADIDDGRVSTVAARRHFTRIGASIGADRRIPREKVSEVADVAGELATQARGIGAAEVSVVATAAVRLAANRDELIAAVQRSTALPVRMVSGREEAELSFTGAANAVGLGGGTLAVVDVGGGSTEIAVGSAADGVFFAESVPVGSSLLCEQHLRDDPPSPAQIDAAHDAVAQALQGFHPSRADRAVAVGGTATSLHQLVGATLTRATLEDGLAQICSRPATEAAAALGLPVERVRLLPGGIAILCGVADLLGPGLTVVSGGLREGVVLQRAHETA